MTDTAVITTIIPQELRTKLRDRSRRSTLLKMENLLDLRDFIEENYAQVEAMGWMNFYKEAAEVMICAAETVRRDLSIIRSYETARLRDWVRNGLSFDHIETANWLQEYCTYYADQILDAAVTMGSGIGKTMTVAEMESFALGERRPRPQIFNANRLLEQLGYFPTKLNLTADAAAEWETLLNPLREFVKRYA